MASRDLGSAPDDLGVADDLGTDTTGGALSLNLVAGEIGGPGTADDIGGLARLNDPFGLALDGAGNMYVTESTSGTIRKIVLATGQVTKIFGVVSDRKAVVDGYAKNAQFAFPQGLALDGAGNLYVSDISAIRKIDLATGVVGTLPSYTPLGQLAGMVLDGAGNLYVVDVDYNNLHKLVLATGEASTIASGFTHPYGLTVDSTSNLYVADTWNSSLSKGRAGRRHREPDCSYRRRQPQSSLRPGGGRSRQPLYRWWVYEPDSKSRTGHRRNIYGGRQRRRGGVRAGMASAPPLSSSCLQRWYWMAWAPFISPIWATTTSVKWSSPRVLYLL